MKIEIATDGALSKSRSNQGGIGIIFYFNGVEAYRYGRTIPNTTISKCELLAVIIALNSISKPVDSIVIYSDSQYVIYSITKGWRRKKNIKYWELFDKALNKAKSFCSDISFEWIEGHSDSNEPPYSYNNAADSVAVFYSQLYETKKQQEQENN